MPERPFNPDKLVANDWGEMLPECFGHCGYGDGMLHPGKCHPRGCTFNPGCYAVVREYVEREHALTCKEYEAERQRLRDQGLDSNQIVVALAGKGTPPPTQELYLANVRMGQIDSGWWTECGEEGCDTLIMQSAGYLFCVNHRPAEDDDGAARDGGEVAIARDGDAPDQP